MAGRGDRYLVSDPIMEPRRRSPPMNWSGFGLPGGACTARPALLPEAPARPVTEDQDQKGDQERYQPQRPRYAAPGGSPLSAASKIQTTRSKNGGKSWGLYLAQLGPGMQEEIGTGGGGFRLSMHALPRRLMPFTPTEALPRSLQRVHPVRQSLARRSNKGRRDLQGQDRGARRTSIKWGTTSSK